MLIWRGWGVLAAAYAGLAMIFFAGAASTVLEDSMLPLSIAVGLLLAASATWLTGSALNQTRPQQAFQQWYAARSEQLDALVAGGRFQLGPGQPLPDSPEQAQQQADWLLEQEEQQFRAARFNRHTLFFIPMQYVAFALVAIALLVLVIGVYGIVVG